MRAVSRLTDTSDAEDAGHVAVEATSGVRTVTAFGLQGHMLREFSSALARELRLTSRRAAAAGIGTGASSLVMFGSYSAVFFAGARLIGAGQLDFQDMLQVRARVGAWACGGARERDALHERQAAVWRLGWRWRWGG